MHIRGCARRSFPLAGKNQRATGGSQTETAPWLPPDPLPLGLRAEPPAARGYWLPRGGGLERLEVLCLSSAGGRAAPVGRPRCARGGGPLAAPGGCGDPLPVARACGAFFPTRGKEPKGARWQPKRDSTMAAPGPLAAWLGGETSCRVRLIASSRGRLGTPWGVMSVVRWRPGGTGGPPSLRARWWALWLRLQARGSFAHRLMCGAVLSHSRERTKGRPMAAKSRQHHGCPRTPRRLA